MYMINVRVEWGCDVRGRGGGEGNGDKWLSREYKDTCDVQIIKVIVKKINNWHYFKINSIR